jgi:hypothetical protein
MCFDANMRYFERGCRFKAEVLSINKESELFLNGVRKGHLIECVLPSDQPEGDEIVVALVTLPNGVEITVYDSTDLSIEWLEFHKALQIPGMNAMTSSHLKSIGVGDE